MAHLPFGPGWKLILRALLVLRILVALLWHPLLLLPSFVTLMLRKSLNHLSQIHLGVPLGPLHSNSELLRGHMSTNDAQVTVLPSFLECFRLSSCGVSSLEVFARLQRPYALIPFPAMWSSWSLCRVPSIRSLVDSSASTMHAYFVLHIPGALQSPCTLFLWSCKALLLASELPTFSAHFA